jgi:MYXO-CTERM domain-containing protein
LRAFPERVIVGRHEDGRKIIMSRFAIAAFVLAAGALVPVAARAHFILQAPPSWAALDDLGGPQKSAPCGQADPGQPASPTGTVTAFAPGATVTITINETIPHPGHYRVVLSTTGQSGLPADPPVTAVGTDPCGSTVIQIPPVFPVLVDGMLAHTGAFSGPQTFTVTLPTDLTCTNCTLQVAEFMSNHGLNNPGGCFYHHCADISIQQGGGGDAGPVEPGGSSSGCGCAVGGARASLAGVLLLLAAVAGRRRQPPA